MVGQDVNFRSNNLFKRLLIRNGLVTSLKNKLVFQSFHKTMENVLYLI
jgi:hypothetical protein